MTNTITNQTSISAGGREASSGTGQREPSAILRWAFLFDRAIVLGSGVGVIAFSSILANQLAWPTWIVVALGLVLLPYGAVLHWIVNTKRHSSSTAIATMVTDVAWVAASIAVVVTLSAESSTAAPWLVGAQALIVADVGLAKLVGFVRKGA